MINVENSDVPVNAYTSERAPKESGHWEESIALRPQLQWTSLGNDPEAVAGESATIIGLGRSCGSLIAAGRGGSRGVGVGGGSGLLLLFLGEADLSGHSLGLLGEGDLGGNGQDSRLGPVAILIGHPRHGHILAIGIDVGVAAAHHHHVNVVDGLHLAGGLLLDAILGLEGEVFLAVLALAVASVSGGRIARDSGYQPASGRAAQPAQPIAIVRSVYNAPSAESQNYDFSFETENGIQQEASGEMKLIDNAEVMVMRGSYTYIDAEGQDVTVSWVADENGYRAESAILPIAPEIPFPEQAEAVAAQIRFAQQEEQQAAASSNSYSSAPAPAGRYEAASAPAPAPAQPYYGRQF
eukprot:maker-scaffold850_size89018-snap-gene-0.26 protein:Tk01248 transcript:maker-scaffold850_size89018-snap-gene-0.26-mRNA-1 annotation:"GI12693"